MRSKLKMLLKRNKKKTPFYFQSDSRTNLYFSKHFLLQKTEIKIRVLDVLKRYSV